MAKLTRKKMARGTQFYADHLEFADDIANELERSGVEYEQLEQDEGVTLVHITVPFLDGRFYANTRERLGQKDAGSVYLVESPAWVAPFLLPPLQNVWPNTPPETDLNNPPMILDEVMVSWDQRDESAAITGPNHDPDDDGVGDGPVNSGKPWFGKTSYTDVAVAIYGHDIASLREDLGGAAALYAPAAFKLQDEVFSIEIPSAAQHNDLARANPVVRSDINKPLYPFKSYVVAVYAPNLGDLWDEDGQPAKFANMALVNVQITLRIRIRMGRRSNYNDNHVQNIPTEHDGDTTNFEPVVGLDLPEPGDVMRAYGAEGFTEELTKLDDFFERGLRGGYTKFSTFWGTEQSINEDAVPFCWAIPMHQNQQSGAVSKHSVGYCANMPASHDEPIWDIRHIALPFPCTIHHVFAGLNWQSVELGGNIYGNLVGAQMNDGAQVNHHIGVGIGTGMKGDHFTYDQVAEAFFYLNEATLHDGFLIDRIGHPYRVNPAPVAPPAAPVVPVPEYIWEIVQLELVNDGVHTADRFINQGSPVFAGPAANGGVADGWRRNLGGIQPNCGGAEQWLEVRWKICFGSQLATPSWDDIVIPGPANVPNSMVVGYGGNFVYIVGEAYLTS